MQQPHPNLSRPPLPLPTSPATTAPSSPTLHSAAAAVGGPEGACRAMCERRVWRLTRTSAAAAAAGGAQEILRRVGGEPLGDTYVRQYQDLYGSCSYTR